MKLLEAPEWGPRRLREILSKFTDAINERTPVKGTGINIEENKNGAQFSTETDSPVDTSLPGSIGGTGGGTSINVYGAFNGAPALFHLLQSSPPTPL